MTISAGDLQVRRPGFTQGITLLLPVTMAVVGVSLFTATVGQMQDHFRGLRNGDYLVNLLQTMPGIWIALFSPVAGWLADRFGRRNLLMISMVVYAAAGAAPFFLDDIYAILLTRCLVGMCEAVVLTVTTTMLSDYFHGLTRERWLAGQTGLASASSLLIVPLGGYLGARFGWQGPFLAYLYALVLVVAIAMFCWEPVRSRDDGADAVDEPAPPFPWLRMLGVCTVTIFGSVMFYSTITQNANAFIALGVADPARIGELATLSALGVPIGTVLFWLLSARMPVLWMMVLEFFMVGVGFLGMGASATPGAYIVAANLEQAGCGMLLPTLLIWGTRGLPFVLRGRGTGLWQGAFAVGLFVSGALLTLLGTLLGGLLAVFTALGIACLCAGALALVAGLAAQRRISHGGR